MMKDVIKRVELVMEKFNIEKDNKFSEIIGLEQKTVNNYLKGRRKPSLEFLVKIHEVLNINLDWLITGRGEMQLKESKEAEQSGVSDNELILQLKERIEKLEEDKEHYRQELESKQAIINKLLSIKDPVLDGIAEAKKGEVVKDI
ncbi:helix-turn-helix domain-containing protein [Paludibacter sp. 221]|uniref:helix-turn-helix domain-containing protein n=1 Tax=Paludibacter sp. 221 TaxID=2302939 RepID=UPI0013CFEC76|nr:helix-turn-helix domain-containing protein [Paludibacter sp. 221]NDV46292.1 helix-turn-helix domain-containing protein [Paludibacter sp. 221]